MSELNADVFVVTLEGLEPGATSPLTVLAFVRADEEVDAERKAAAELEHFGWTEVRALRCACVLDAAALPEDFRETMEKALRYGVALIIYDP
ncbi:hypothetical protein [uncultured Phenylobacterium sp.]|uniref:hypothetical protein n=1 Tax=uncultured Phenylobacterium sp. TaxID=349273 RepID=UPI0025DCE412|nr:hypothetical protein [uncultured Phenylobacterium sp.]